MVLLGRMAERSEAEARSRGGLTAVSDHGPCGKYALLFNMLALITSHCGCWVVGVRQETNVIRAVQNKDEAFMPHSPCSKHGISFEHVGPNHLGFTLPNRSSWPSRQISVRHKPLPMLSPTHPAR